MGWFAHVPPSPPFQPLCLPSASTAPDAKIVLWPKERPDDELNGDDPEHIKWLLDQASQRAAKYGIQGVTYRLTQGVVKNIIPNVASTSAVIAGESRLQSGVPHNLCLSVHTPVFLFFCVRVFP